VISSREEKLDYLQILGLFRGINGTGTWTGSGNPCKKEVKPLPSLEIAKYKT
jgi:hypothetical protein